MISDTDTYIKDCHLPCMATSSMGWFVEKGSRASQRYQGLTQWSISWSSGCQSDSQALKTKRLGTGKKDGVGN